MTVVSENAKSLVVTQPLVGGRAVAGGETFDVLDPGTGRSLAEVAAASEGDVEKAVLVGLEAQPGWAAAGSSTRGGLLRDIAGAMEEQADALANLEASDTGKPMPQARDEVLEAAATFRFFASAGETARGVSVPIDGRGVAITMPMPYGVVGLITPWNYPIKEAAWKVAPALAAGNAAVLKPSPLAPMTCLALGRIAAECGLPDGLFSVLPGGAEVGMAIVGNAGIAKVSFTGSSETGRVVASTAAKHLTPCTLELGGKSAAIVFADADLDTIAEHAVGGACMNTGQNCCARGRLLVEAPVVDELLERVRLAAGAWEPGPPDSGAKMGPLISSERRANVANLVDRAIQEGAEVAYSGGISPSADPDGFYYPTTVLTGVAPEGTIAQTEVFGPVLSVIPFRDEADAVTLANGTRYGLAGSVWSQDAARALRVAGAVASGVVSVNSSSAVHLEAPFGGMNDSGYGRELGLEGLESFLQVKSVFLPIA